MPKDHAGTIILVESNSEICQNILSALSTINYNINVIHNSSELFNYLVNTTPDIIILNIDLHEIDQTGVEVFRKLTTDYSSKFKVIIYSLLDRKPWINEIHKIGSYHVYGDILEFNNKNILSLVSNAFQLAKHEVELFNLQIENIFLKKSIIKSHPFIGESQGIVDAKDQIVRLAKADEDMFVIGETGTGKEVAVNYYYLNSNRFGKTFHTVNCSALTETIIESELFGHIKGSFTSADKTKLGLFEKCNNGLLFLDEISNLSLSAQSKILRAIENQEIQIVGGESKKIDTKLIFASNASLEQLLQKNIIRKDLFYRIEGNIIELLPLRERDNDIILLMSYFLSHYSQHILDFDFNKLIELKEHLLSYSWPGNVRELKNFCKSMLINENKINIDLIKRNVDIKINKHNIGSDSSLQRFIQMDKLKDSVSCFEKEFLTYHLKKNLWQISKTAESIGIERTTLYKKLKLYKLQSGKIQ